MHIKKIGIGDAQEVFPVIFKWLEEFGIKFDKNRLIEQYIDMMRRDVIWLCVYDKNKMVGFVVGEAMDQIWTSSKIMVEHFLFVVSSHRGTEAAHLLMEELAKYAADLSCSHILVFPNVLGSTAPDRARAFLEKEGYNFYGYCMKKEV